MLLKVLKNEPNARVSIPKNEVLKSYAASIKEQYSALGAKNVAFSIDGLKLNIQKPGHEVRQSVFYNGWTHGHYVGNVFVFAPDGRIVAMVVNAPGSFHDSTILEYGDLYEKLENLFDETGVCSVVDSAFVVSKKNYFIKSSQDNPVTDNPHDLVIHRQATSVRQMAEWGMGSFQRSVPRIKDTIRFEERGERVLILQMLVRLCNLRASLVGVNQIRNVFNPHLKHPFTM